MVSPMFDGTNVGSSDGVIVMVGEMEGIIVSPTFEGLSVGNCDGSDVLGLVGGTVFKVGTNVG